MDLDGRGGVKDLGVVSGDVIIIGIYYILMKWVKWKYIVYFIMKRKM